MNPTVVLCIVLAIATAVARFKMHQNTTGAQADITAREQERKRVLARLRVVDEQLRRLEERAAELRDQLDVMRQRQRQVNAQIRKVKELTRRRIERDLTERG